MKVTYCSDLHLDVGPVNPVLPGGDVLILAGDTCEVKEMRKNMIDRNGLGIVAPNPDRINTFFREVAELYEHVLIIAGNHEHYNYVIDKTHQRMRDELPDNFHVMENDCFELDDVLFLGATLWTDMNRGDPMTIHAVKWGMNDFHVIRKFRTPTDAVRFTPHDAILAHERTLDYFKTILEMPHNLDKKVVVITHHAPTGQSVDQRYRNDFLMNGGYHSRLDDFILDHTQIKYWIHGHTHHPMDYMVGDYTRVLCNPRGYTSKYAAEHTGWDPDAHFIL